MTDGIERGAVIFRGFTRPVPPERARELLVHIDAFDPPQRCTDRMSNIDDWTVDDIGRAQLLWGDHVPPHADPTHPEAAPTYFAATYDAFGKDRVRVGLVAEITDLSPFDAVLAHVFEATPLEPDPLEIILQPIHPVDPDAIDAPGGFLLLTGAGGAQQIRLTATRMAFQVGGEAEAESFEAAMNTMFDSLGEMMGEMPRELGESMTEEGDGSSMAPDQPTLNDDPITFSLSGVVQPAIDDISTQVSRELGPDSGTSPGPNRYHYSFEPTADTPEGLVREFHQQQAQIESDEELEALASAYGHSQGIYTFGDAEHDGIERSFERSNTFSVIHRIDIQRVDDNLNGEDIRAIEDNQSLQAADPESQPRALLLPILQFLLGDTVVAIAETQNVAIVEGISHTDGGEVPFAHLLAKEDESWRLLV